MDNSSLRVLLIDDNPVFLQVAVKYLGRCRDVTVVGAANGGKEGLAQAIELNPQTILLDLNMPDIPGLELLPELRRRLPQSRIVVLTLYDNDMLREAAFAAGAHAYVAKNSLVTDLEPALRSSLPKQPPLRSSPLPI